MTDELIPTTNIVIFANHATDIRRLASRSEWGISEIGRRVIAVMVGQDWNSA